jgi:hypothetical protein
MIDWRGRVNRTQLGPPPRFNVFQYMCCCFNGLKVDHIDVTLQYWLFKRPDNATEPKKRLFYLALCNGPNDRYQKFLS